MFVGGYGSDVLVFALDLATGSLTSRGQRELGPNPTYFAASADGRFLYVANEDDTRSGITVAAIESDGSLTKLDTEPYTGGTRKGLVYVTVDPGGKFVLAADYNGGHVVVFPVQSDGTLGPLVDEESFDTQVQALTHSVRVHRSGKWAYVANKGRNNVAQFAFDATSGQLTALPTPTIQSRPGPRHIALHPTAEFAYVLHEVDGTLRTYAIGDDGVLSQTVTQATLPTDVAQPRSAAHLTVHPNGKFLYTSNRNYDHLQVFALGSDGRPSMIDDVATVKIPRDFDVDAAGKYLVVAGQGDGTLQTYAIGADGKLTAKGAPLTGLVNPAAVTIVTPPLH